MEKAGDLIEMPPLESEGAADVAAWLRSCGPVKAGVMGMAPLDWLDIAAWVSLAGWPLSPRDAEDLHALSRVYVAAHHDYDGKPAGAPYRSEAAREIVGDGVKIALRASFRPKGKPA